MNLIRKILESDYFKDRPPVLVDIGASGEINPKWKDIAPYSVCIAFDADDREFKITDETNQAYKRLITFNRIVVAEPVKQANFYLTASPFCSSLLKPDTTELEAWIFSPLFSIDKIAQLPAITLPEALAQIKFNYIDWFKTDTQGTDLRLFTSVPVSILDKVLVAEFEPGIIDAYQGEDKLYSVMKEMHERGFWLSTMEVKSIQRISQKYVADVGPGTAKRALRKTPGWAEVAYLQKIPSGDQRQFLMLYIFAVLEKQYGFALEICDAARKIFTDLIFEECRAFVLSKIKAGRKQIPFVILKRQFQKLFSRIHD
jgi:hypothetical protein